MLYGYFFQDMKIKIFILKKLFYLSVNIRINAIDALLSFILK